MKGLTQERNLMNVTFVKKGFHILEVVIGIKGFT